MTATLTIDDLPLRYRTPGTWAEGVLEQPLYLLNDHAHLERKAAINALDMLTRWPRPVAPEHWHQILTAIARDEVDHLATVVKLMNARGGALELTHRNSYASELQHLVRRGEGSLEIMDRLLISALIEARSSERFALLAAAAEDRELIRLYRELFSSEAGHYHVFLDLARELPDASGLEARWDTMLEREAEIITRQPPGPRMHSGTA